MTHMAQNDRSREVRATLLGQVLTGGDAELGRERLDQHRHQVAGDDDPQQHVAELGAALAMLVAKLPGSM